MEGHDQAPPPTEAADVAADVASDGEARAGKPPISLPLLAALMLIGAGGSFLLGAMILGLGPHRPAAAAQTQAVAPARPAEATPAAALPQPAAVTCDTPDVLDSIVRGLQGVQHLPPRPVPRERFVGLETLAHTDHGVECGVTLAAGPHSDDIRAGYYRVEYRDQADDNPAVASNAKSATASAN